MMNQTSFIAKPNQGRARGATAELCVQVGGNIVGGKTILARKKATA